MIPSNRTDRPAGTADNCGRTWRPSSKHRLAGLHFFLEPICPFVFPRRPIPLILPMIEVKGLAKHYGPKRAADGISFTVRKGDTPGFLGPNGAGKSTTMKMITGFIRPPAGTAVVDGHDVTRDPVVVKTRIGYLPESAPAYGEMTVNEYLGFIAETRGFRDAAQRRERVERVIALTHIDGVRTQTIETLSKGY